MQSTASVDPMVLSPASLAVAFADVPDPRRTASIVYPLPAMLTMAVAAILANHLSVLAITEWGADQDERTLTALRFPTSRTPCHSTLQRLFAKLDGDALASTLTTCFTPGVVSPVDELYGAAIDGKAQRGRLRFPGGGCPVHALSAFCHDRGVVLAQESIAAPAGTDRGEDELTVAPALLARLDWQGRVLTGDALFCQRTLCQQVRDAGDEYLVAVKQNQKALYRDIQLLFDPSAAEGTWPLTDRRSALTLDDGHGRTLERRVITASTDLVGYLDWPGCAQVLRIERTWRERDTVKRAVSSAMTRLPPDAAGPARLLALKRGHWAIENRRHRCKDVNPGEDASLIHADHGPRVMALLRDAAVSVLHRAGVRQITARLRRHSQHPERAVALVVGPLPTGA